MSSSSSSSLSSSSSPEEGEVHHYQRSTKSWVPAPSQGDRTILEMSTRSDFEEPATEAASLPTARTQHKITEDPMLLRKDSTHDLLDDDLCESGKDNVFKQERSQDDSPSNVQPACNHDRIESDRKEEFEETSSRGRAAARQKAEKSSSNDNQATQAQSRVREDEKTEEHEGPESTKRESDSPATGGEQTVLKQRFTIVTPRIQAPWVDEAYSACKANKKSPLKNGDLLIVLDPNDYSKSCLVDSRVFCRASESFARLYSLSKAASQGCGSEQELTGLLVLQVRGLTPEFCATSLDSSSPDTSRTFKLEDRPEALHQKADGVKIKIEPGRETASSTGSAACSAEQSVNLDTDWPKACDSLLRSVITRQRAYGVSKNDLTLALPQIEGIVTIAQEFGLAHLVQGDFDSLFLSYVGTGKFWELIARMPVRCLKIGIALKNLPVYEEAFKHLVGSSANFKTGKHFDGLSSDIQAVIHRRSRELYNLRRDVNEDLLLISLTAGQYDGLRSGEYLSSTVSQHNQPDAYSTVNIVRDWMAEHIGYLRGDTSQPPHPYYLCDHKQGCNTVAGFYRAVAASGDAYLPIDLVWETFSTDFLEAEGEGEPDCDAVKLPLAALKTQAAEYVSGLVKSTLHLPSRDELDYLTCVTVGAEDLPWDVTCKGEESEDDEDNDLLFS